MYVWAPETLGIQTAGKVGGRGGGVSAAATTGWQGAKGRELGDKLNILNEMYSDFVCWTNFKLLTQIQGNSVNNCDLFTVHNCPGHWKS
jgi:hypothetical protein